MGSSLNRLYDQESCDQKKIELQVFSSLLVAINMIYVQTG